MHQTRFPRLSNPQVYPSQPPGHPASSLSTQPAFAQPAPFTLQNNLKSHQRRHDALKCYQLSVLSHNWLSFNSLPRSMCFSSDNNQHVFHHINTNYQLDLGQH